MKFGKFYRWVMLCSAAIVGMGTVALAESEKPTCEMYMTAYSQYIWRGYELSKDSVVFFPETKVSYKGFSFDIWGDLDTDYAGERIDNGTEMVETDYTLSYGNTIGMFRYSLGWIYYDFDGGEDQEVYATFGINTILSPEISVFRGIEHTDSWYLKLAASHRFSLENGWSIDIGGWVGYYDIPEGAIDGDDYSEFHDATISAKLNIPLTDWCTLTPSINYSFPLSGESDDLIQSLSFDGKDAKFLYGGLTLSVTF